MSVDRMGLKCSWHLVTRWWSAGTWTAIRQCKWQHMMLLWRYVTGWRDQLTPA